MAISPQDGVSAAERPTLKAVKTAPEAPSAPAAVPVPRKRQEAPRPIPVAKRAAPPRTVFKLRHYASLASFLLLVLLPLAATVTYLYFRAEDEYHSEVSFSIRSEEPGAAAAGILGAITGIRGGSSSAAEPDILFEYIHS